jgi:hypothetical protein
VSISFGKARVFGRIKAGIHAGQDGKPTGGGKGECAFASKIFCKGRIGGDEESPSEPLISQRGRRQRLAKLIAT